MTGPVPFDGSAEWVEGSLRVIGKARFPSDALARRARMVQVHVAPDQIEELPIRRP